MNFLKHPSFFFKWLSSCCIRTHLLLLVSFSILPALGILLYTGLILRNHEIHVAQENALQMVKVVASKQEGTTENIQQLLSYLARLPEVIKRDASACNQLLNDLIKTHPSYAAILVATKEGKVFASAPPSSFKPFSITDRKYFQEVMKTRRFAIGETIVEKFYGKPSLHFAYPVFDPQRGDILGIVAAAFNAQYYGQVFNQILKPEGASISISDFKLNRLYRYPQYEGTIGHHETLQMRSYLTGNGEEGLFTATGIDGVKRMYAYKNLYYGESKIPYLYLRVGIPEAQALAQSKSVLLRSSLLLATAAFLAVLLAIVLGNFFFVKRLNALANASEHLEHGDLNARVAWNPHWKGEVGQLAKAFNQMAAALEQRDIEYQKTKDALVESEQQLRAIMRGFSIPTFVINKQHKIVSWNRALEEMSGISVDTVMGTNEHWRAFYYSARPCLADLLVDERFNDLEKWYGDKYYKSPFIEGAYEGVGFFPALGKNGQWLHFTAAVLRDSHGTVFGAMETLEDITARQLAEEALRESEQRYRIIADNTYTWEFWVDPDGKCLYCSPSCYELSGHHQEEYLRDFQLLSENIHPEDRPLFQDHIKTSYNGPGKLEFRMVHSDGTIKYVEHICLPVFDNNENYLGRRGSNRDITEKKKAEEVIRDMAYHDSLTGLPNRRLLSDRFSMEIARSDRQNLNFAIMVLDMDHFKGVNDTFGHEYGDKLLQIASTTLQNLLRKQDTIARIGGDEFVLLLPGIKRFSDIEIIAEKIVNAFRTPVVIEDQELLITISIGIAIYPHDGKDIHELLRNADLSMYQVKQQGRNNYFRLAHPLNEPCNERPV